MNLVLFWSLSCMTTGLNGLLYVQVFKRAEDKGIKIDVTERFKDRLVDEGYNPAYGARPLRRAIMRLLEDSMAERMLAGDIKVHITALFVFHVFFGFDLG